MSCYIYIFLDGKGNETVIQGNPVNEQISRSHSYFCPRCGRIWARVLSDDSKAYHDFHGVPCKYHPSKNHIGPCMVAGSILNNNGYKDNAYSLHLAVTLGNLPDAVVKEEFEVHLQHYEDNKHEYKETDQQELPFFNT
jgi:hypothetical protein